MEYHYSHKVANVIVDAPAQPFEPSPKETDWRECRHWWHWAVKSPAGRAALAQAAIPINADEPWQNATIEQWDGKSPVYDGATLGKYWRAQPWIDEGEPANDTSDQFNGAVSAARTALGEPLAGVFYCELVTYGVGASLTGSHQTFVAVNHAGTRAVVLQVSPC